MTKAKRVIRIAMAVSFLFFAYCCFILPAAGAQLSLFAAMASLTAAVLG